jgi:hypothetical protein
VILSLDHANAPKDSVATSSLPKYGNIELGPRPLDAEASFCQAVEILSDIVVLEIKTPLSALFWLETS